MSDEKWELAGEISVDAGLCWIGDPCYLYDLPPKTWDRFVDEHYSDNPKPEIPGVKQWNFEKNRPGLGMSMNTFGGDGVYKIYVDRDIEGRIKAAKVVF